MRPRRVAASLLSGTLALTLMGVSPGLPAPAGAAPVPESDAFVRRVSFDLLNDADPTRATLDAQIAAVGSSNGGVFAAELQRTEAGRGAIVDDAYEDVLRRNADPAGRDFFVESLGQGFTSMRLTATFLGSGEYYAKRGGGTDSGFVDSLYLDALGRAPDADGKAYFLDQLAQGRTRSSIAAFFIMSAEGRTVLVRGLYSDLLRRGGDADGVTFFAEMVRQGMTRERIVSYIVSSPEYLDKAQADLGDEQIIVLTAANELVFSSTGDVEAVERTVPVLGLPEGASLLGIDVRPSNGVLYGVASNGQVVTINQGSGFTNLVGVPIPDFDPSGGVGVDFNPAADALRVVTGSDNYRVNATTGALANGTPDGTLAFTPGDINQGRVPDASAAAYTNSVRGLPLPTETALYDIDETTSSVVQQVPANDGTLVTKGKLRLDASAVNGFDISPDGPQRAYALLDAPNAGPGVWRVDLGTGEPRLISTGAPEGAIGLAVIGEETVTPVETAYAVTDGPVPVFQTFTTDGNTPPAKLLTGLGPFGTTVLGMDVRPATGQIYALTSLGQVVTIDASGPSAVATPLGDPIPDFAPGEAVGFDFNPAADAIRVVTGDQNYRLRAADAVVVGEGVEGAPGPLTFAPGDVNEGATADVAGAAYTNSFRSPTLPTATALFDIDTDLDVVVRQNPANAGTLLTIGGLGIDVSDAVGFDSSGGLGQTTYAVLETAEGQGLYTVDLATGEATLLFSITPGTYTAFAVA